MDSAPMKPLDFVRHSPADMRRRAQAFADDVATRRSVRHFSSTPIDLDVVETCIRAAATAPSGANKQPWRFVMVTDPDKKKQIRVGAQAEEEAFYGGRASQRWLADLEPFGTDAHKPMLEDAPVLIAVFALKYGQSQQDKHYYIQESVGIAVGILLAALHHAGLATLTHTPSPMAFLGEILGRPANERPFLLIPVGMPVADCQVPDVARKPFDEVLVRA